MGDTLKVRVASKASQPVASILTLHHKGTLVYKYGCSDRQFSNMGGMHLLFWKAIQEAKGDGLLEFDMGRSDCDNLGLLDFKDRWGATRSALVYLRYTARRSLSDAAGLKMRIAKQIVSHTPDQLLATAGRVLYRHIG